MIYFSFDYYLFRQTVYSYFTFDDQFHCEYDCDFYFRWHCSVIDDVSQEQSTHINFNISIFFLFHFHLQFNQWPLWIGQIAFHDLKLKTLLTAIDRMLSFVCLIFVAAFNLCNA